MGRKSFNEISEGKPLFAMVVGSSIASEFCSMNGRKSSVEIIGKTLAFSFRNKSVSKDTKQRRVTSLPDLSIGKANSSS